MAICPFQAPRRDLLASPRRTLSCSLGGCDSFLLLPGLEDEVEKNHDDDETQGEDVDEQMPVHLGRIRVLGVGQGAGQVGGTGETVASFTHRRSSTGGACLPGCSALSFMLTKLWMAACIHEARWK